VKLFCGLEAYSLLMATEGAFVSLRSVYVNSSTCPSACMKQFQISQTDFHEI
jgi:hypothetical protein